MKINKFLTALTFTATLAISQIVDLPSNQTKSVQAQTTGRPLVVFVNGKSNGYVWHKYTNGTPYSHMNIVVDSLPANSEIVYVSWDTFVYNSFETGIGNDALFLRQGKARLNSIDPNRPVIIIGHSFGGDSILSLLPRINRRIQFVGVIDPTAAGGLREPITRRTVPNNVDYFFNRWQENALDGNNIVPFDSRLVSGRVRSCNAKKCDQREQSNKAKANGDSILQDCAWYETCRKKSVPLMHNKMPTDARLQTLMAEGIKQAIANFTASQPQPSNSLNLVLDANNGNGDIYLYPKSDKNNRNHLWRIVGVTDGYHMIISKQTGGALDANGGTGNLYLHPKPDKANPNHLWKLTQLPGDYWLITSRVNGYALDANTGNGNLYLHPKPDTANPNHLWKFLYIDDYTIIGSRLKN